ncbi:MAG TPA: chromate resistance protein ChrB domain-containing protein [Labilithrix sp.]|jgi:hypothetical protein
MSREAGTEEARWLLLIHQIPPKPAYFRQKVLRRLNRLGAVAIKNSVYVLPRTDAAREDAQWLARAITSDGGEATICEAAFVDGVRDDQVEALFRAARQGDWAQLAEEARGAGRELPRRLAHDDERRSALEADVARLRKQADEIRAIDFFGAQGREAAEAAIATLARRLERKQDKTETRATPAYRKDDYRGRVWVTRANVHVDRIASGWLVRRYIDPGARFAFVPGQGYKAKAGEVTFDMFEADFTHVGDACTFEVLVERFELREAGLAAIAEIVHDIDVKDRKFERPEAPGVAALIAGIALSERDDEARIALGGRMFEALLELYRRKRGSA